MAGAPGFSVVTCAERYLGSFMRTLALLPILTTFILVWHTAPAHGECYGDAAAAYGCGVPAAESAAGSNRNTASLEEFGSTGGPILPDTGSHNRQGGPVDYLTPEERTRMMRNIVLGRGGAMRSKSAQLNAVNSAARPLRRSGSMPARIR